MILTLKSSQCQPPNSAHLGILRTSSKHSCLSAPSQVPWGPSGGGSVPARSPPAFHAASPARPLSPFWGDHEHSFIPFSLWPQKRYSQPPSHGWEPQATDLFGSCPLLWEGCPWTPAPSTSHSTAECPPREKRGEAVGTPPPCLHCSLCSHVGALHPPLDGDAGSISWDELASWEDRVPASWGIPVSHPPLP